MDIHIQYMLTVLAVLVLLSSAVNFMHWLCLRQSAFFIFPRTHWLRIVFTVWAVALIVSSALTLLDLLPGWILLCTASVHGIVYQAYSLVARHWQSRCSERLAS